MKPSGAHTHPDGGSGIGAAAVVVLAAIVAAAVAGPVIRAVTDLIEVLAVTVAVILGVSLAAGTVLVAWRLRRGRQNTPLVVHQVTPVTRQAAESLPAPPRPAIEASREVHLHFHGVTAEDVAAIIGQHQAPGKE